MIREYEPAGCVEEMQYGMVDRLAPHNVYRPARPPVCLTRRAGRVAAQRPRMVCALVGLVALGLLSVDARADGPVIDVWYGPVQQFGQVGQPQNWINILGNVSDSDGVASLSYTLNNGPQVSLSMGPTDRRLNEAGDFNADIAYSDLLPGPNEVIITAVDTIGDQSTYTVTVEYSSGNKWPLPYSIDWSTVSRIDEVAQVVDGKWELTPAGVRIADTGYDRLLAIGDLSWTDYEVTVPITIHELDLDGIYPPPGLGLLMRWTGHTDDPVPGLQPKAGYNPHGIIGWWSWHPEGIWALLRFYLAGVSQTYTPEFEVPYVFKLRVESTPGEGGLYRLKVWPQSEAEPAEWRLVYQSGASNLDHGSFLLLSHHVDATFGNVTVTPVGSTTLAISAVQATALSTSEVLVTWTTNNPADSSVAYGLTAEYELGSVDDVELVTEHAIMLTDLTPETEYHFQITSDDGENEPASSDDLTFTTPATLTISDVQATALSATEALVTWTTNNAADSSVAYGLTAEYELGSVDDVELVTEHAITLTDLVPETEYHVQVTSSDGVDEPASSDDLTFITPAALLEISDVQATALSATEVIVTWASNDPSDSSVAYGLTAEYELGSVDDAELVTEHSIALTDLTPETEYHFQVTSDDGVREPASSGDLTVTTPAPLVISDIQTTPLSATEALVSWVTNVPANSSVAYGLTAGV